MKRLAYGRLAAVVTTAAIVATLAQWQGVFGTPLPEGAGLDEILTRVQIATIRSVNAVITACMGAAMGFFVRADKSGPFFVTKDNGNV